MTSIDGFIIVNRGWPELIRLEMGRNTFGGTAGEAWRRHIGPSSYDNKLEFSAIVQRWSDKGYGPAKATLSLVGEQ